MIIRSIQEGDLEKLNQINGYENQIEIKIDNNVLGAAVAEDLQGRIISGGIIRSISEVVLVTDKSFHARQRLRALEELLNLAIYISNKNGRNELNVFVQDKKFAEILIKKFGFQIPIGKFLVKTW